MPTGCNHARKEIVRVITTSPLPMEKNVAIFLIYLFYIFLACVFHGHFCGGARGVMVIDVGNGHGDSSSNPGR